MLFNNIRIAGISAAVPKTVVNNFKDHDFVSIKKRADIVKLTGVEEYRKAADGQTTADLCQVATENLFKELDVDPLSIDGVIFITMTPDYVAPSTACVLQDKLGLSTATVAFDVNLGCSGYVYGLYIACSLIQGGGLKKVLLLAGDTQTKLCHREDQNVVFLLGDAGTATIVETCVDAPEIKMRLNTDGSRKDSLIIPAGGFRLPSDSGTKKIREQVDSGIRSAEHLYLDGIGVFNFSITDVAETINDFMEEENLDANNINYFVLHQANKFMIDRIAKKSSFPPEKVLYSLLKYGNTSSASIPLTLLCNSLKMEGKRSQNCLLSGFGIGLSWGVIHISLENVCFPKLSEV
ncbi:ketoacyl-ACP synthase III [Nitrospinaceae bacterium]|nr:ketoacyl-ACP synthase III [Nitrospinaceae bacterium]